MMTRDERIAKYRLGLNDLYLPYYDALCAELTEGWGPCQGYRSFVEQDALWMQGRTLAGSIVTRAKGGESAHNYGCGSDWCVFDADGKPHWPPASDALWADYKDAVEKLGLRWGGEFRDPSHNELRLSCSWPDVLEIYGELGMESANKFIKTKMV